MASIWDLWEDTSATTNEELFEGVVSKEEEEKEPDIARSAVASAAGPAGVNPFLIEQEEVVREETPVEKYLKETVGIENPKGMTDKEKQSALNDFLEKRQAENIFAPPTAEEKQMEAEGISFQQEATRKGFSDFEIQAQEEQDKLQAGITAKARLDEQLDRQLNELKNQYSLLTHSQKFEKIEANKKRSLDSINRSITAVITNKATAGTNFGRMKLQNLIGMAQEVEQQAAADMEKLGGDSYQKMNPDEQLTYTRLMENGRITPQARLQYVAADNMIKKSTRNLLLNIPEDKRDQVDEFLFGKKKVENGQIQYDQDNEPVRVTKGLAFKNQFGVYEPSVDLDIFESKLKDIGGQFSAARAETGGVQELDVAKLSKSTNDEAENLLKISENAYVAAGYKKEDYSLEDAVKKGVTDKATANQIRNLLTLAEEYGTTGRTEGGEGKPLITKLQEEKSQKTQQELANTLESLSKAPSGDAINSLYQSGATRVFEVSNNKLVEVPSEKGENFNEEYIIISDPELGAQVVNIGKGKINKFLEEANKYFYVNGEFTEEAPGFLGTGESIREMALKSIPVAGPALAARAKAAQTGEKKKVVSKLSVFNSELSRARDAKLDLLKEQTKAEKQKKKQLKF